MLGSSTLERPNGQNKDGCSANDCCSTSVHFEDINDVKLLKLNYREKKSILKEEKRSVNVRINNLKLRYHERMVTLMKKIAFSGR